MTCLHQLHHCTVVGLTRIVDDGQNQIENIEPKVKVKVINIWNYVHVLLELAGYHLRHSEGKVQFY